MAIANPEKAEVGFTALGRDWIFVMDFAAAVVVDREVPGFMSGAFTGGSAAALLTVFRLGLDRHQPNTPEAQVIDIIQEIGLLRAMSILGESVDAGYGKADPTASPRKAVGTGKRK